MHERSSSHPHAANCAMREDSANAASHLDEGLA
jgi:hypothetical protein